jgi:hypothetical protein
MYFCTNFYGISNLWTIVGSLQKESSLLFIGEGCMIGLLPGSRTAALAGLDKVLVE